MPFSIAASIAAGDDPGGGNPSNGAPFTARNPSVTAAFAVAANPAGVRIVVARLMLAYTGSVSLTRPPNSAYVGTSSAFPARSQRACSMALQAVAETSPPLATMRLGALTIGADVERRLAIDELEESAQLRLHARGVGGRRVGEPERVRRLAQAGQPGIGSQADEQPDGSGSRADRQEFEPGHAQSWRRLQHVRRPEHGPGGKSRSRHQKIAPAPVRLGRHNSASAKS